jgi:hypothetical protein
MQRLLTKVDPAAVFGAERQRDQSYQLRQLWQGSEEE